MKTLSLLAAAPLALGSAAYAQTGASSTTSGSDTTTAPGQLSVQSQDEGAQAALKRDSQASTGDGAPESRAEVRAEAAAANKAHSNPQGEESVKDQNKGGIKQP
jgi:hypothetical protein